MKKIRRGLACFLIALFVVQQMPAQVVHAMTLEEKIEELKQQMEQNKQQQDVVKNEKDNAQEKANGLKQEENQLGYTYNTLNNQLQSVTNEISETENAIATTTSDIEKLKKELEEAEKARDAQYEGMKKRIQFMYENGNNSLLVSILTSGSVAEFVQRAEYISMIASYDRKMVQSYDELMETISSKSEELSTKKKELSAYNETLADKQDELDDLVGNAGDAYAAKKGETSAAQMTADELNATIQQLEQANASLEAQIAQAQFELAQQIGGDITDTEGSMTNYSDADLKLLAGIIQAEAGGESTEGKLAVGSVVMNRVMSSRFPSTISGVVYQPNQFTPTRNGVLAVILENGPREDCYEIARRVLAGERNVSYCFFWATWYANQNPWIYEKTEGVFICNQYYYNYRGETY
ncbi:MAG: cell wall hydrolase [Lachnospiraceae bacterium]|nr:cell wall hydrolase [Lachnospiraceae bacterium]